jgi:two-component system cell cycle response regulator DivK
MTVATILVVEDNPANLKLATLLLENAGYTVLAAGDGETGIRLAGERLPDLVLMDIQMPGIDGLEATRRLRADPATARLRIVALTALAMKGDEERILAAGCDGYIAKPFRPAEFLEKVAAALGQDHAG